MVEVREFQWIAEEENRGVVSHKVPVALIGVEFHCKTTDIALGICGSPLSCYGREAEEVVGLFPFLGEDTGLRILGDVMGDGECTEGA